MTVALLSSSDVDLVSLPLVNDPLDYIFSYFLRLHISLFRHLLDCLFFP